MFVTILVITIIVSSVLILLLSVSTKDKKKSWVHFMTKGKEAGFSFKEIELLHRLATRSSLPDPTSLFWAQSQLDRCIKNLVRSTRLSGRVDRGTQNFLSKLYDFRKKIEIENPRNKPGISSSRQIDEGQTLRVLSPGMGVHFSKIVKTTTQYLIIARPHNPKLPTGFSWIGLKLAIYFWREDDAGYVFDSDVQDEVFSRGTPALKISHGESLLRTQKRRSIRIKIHKPAYMYILDHEKPDDVIEMNPGLRCFVEDISDTGCAILIGGKGVVELRIKIQFILNNMAICFSGTVRAVEYMENENKSLLRTEADPMTIDMRNHILGEVFGMLPEDDDELSFRDFQEEPAAANENA